METNDEMKIRKRVPAIRGGSGVGPTERSGVQRSHRASMKTRLLEMTACQFLPVVYIMFHFVYFSVYFRLSI